MVSIHQDTEMGYFYKSEATKSGWNYILKLHSESCKIKIGS